MAYLEVQDEVKSTSSKTEIMQKCDDKNSHYGNKCKESSSYKIERTCGTIFEHAGRKEALATCTCFIESTTDKNDKT